MAQKIEIVRGTSNDFIITVFDADGREYILSSDERLVFGIKKKLDDAEAIFTKTAVNRSDGSYAVSIEPGDTAELEPGRYFYDVGLKSGTDFFSVIDFTPIIIQPNITTG